MKENVIISLADSNYYELLDELVNSIKRFKESENIAICILDAGLSDEQKNEKRIARLQKLKEDLQTMANRAYVLKDKIKDISLKIKNIFFI